MAPVPSDHVARRQTEDEYTLQMPADAAVIGSKESVDVQRTAMDLEQGGESNAQSENDDTCHLARETHSVTCLGQQPDSGRYRSQACTERHRRLSLARQSCNPR